MSYAMLTLWLCCFGAWPQEPDEYEVVREIVQGLNQEAFDLESVSKLSKSIPAASPLRPVALQAVTLQLIRQREYEKALSLLEKQDSSKDRWPLSLRVAHEEWKLWLFLELRKKEDAESQFKSLIKTLLSKSFADGSEKNHLARYLGNVVGMLHAAGEEALIDPSLCKRAEELIAESDSQSLVSLFAQQEHKIQKWQSELAAVYQSLRGAEDSQLSQARDQINTVLQESKGRLEEFRAELKAMKKGEDRLEQEAKQIQAQVQNIVAQENTETEGRPREPVAPNRPDRPEVKRRFDRDKNEWVIDQSATNRDRSRYEREQRQYQDRVRDYERDRADFPDKMRAWVQKDADRRAKLANAKQERSQQWKAKQEEIARQQEEIKAQREAIDSQELAVDDAERKWHQTEGVAWHRSRFPDVDVLGPSCYRLFDAGDEAERLLAVARQIRTP